MTPPLLIIVGPTAVGKTAFALDLAEHLGGEIISADSATLYRGLDIGAAKPTPAERARVSHHLIDVADPDEVWSVAQFQAAATAAIADCHRRGVWPLLVGGSGQYIRAVVEGWQPPPQAADPRLRAALEALVARAGREELSRWLVALDPAAAEQVDLRNPRRVVRALEVIFTSGRPFTSQRGKQPPPWRIRTLGLTRPRPELYARIDARVDAMIAAGLEDEVRGLLARYDPALPALNSLGYQQMIGYLRGQYNRETAIALIKKDTRRFVRQQANWFRPGDASIDWLDAGEVSVGAVVASLRGWVT